MDREILPAADSSLVKLPQPVPRVLGRKLLFQQLTTTTLPLTSLHQTSSTAPTFYSNSSMGTPVIWPDGCCSPLTGLEASSPPTAHDVNTNRCLGSRPDQAKQPSDIKIWKENLGTKMYVKEDQLEENFSFAAGIKLLNDLPWLPSLFLLYSKYTLLKGNL